MDSKDYFGITTNLLLSLTVVAYGTFVWVRGFEHAPFKRRAYRCWWASWVVWVIAWSLILISTLADWEASMPLKITTMAFDNLNSICLILLFFVLTRGDDFGQRDILFASAGIACPIAAAIVVLYLVVGGINPQVGYLMHFAWSLCLDIIAPMLVGWAVYLRFNTMVPLAVGFTYGLIQPFVDTAELGVPAINDLMKPYSSAVTMLTAGLKVVWALAFMQVLVYGSVSGHNLVKPTAERFHYLPLKRPLDTKVSGHGITLVALYVGLLIAMLMIYRRKVESFGIALGVVTGFLALLQLFRDIWKYFVGSDGRVRVSSSFASAATLLVNQLNDLILARDSGQAEARRAEEDKVGQHLAQLARVITEARPLFSTDINHQFDTLTQFLQRLRTDEVKEITADSELMRLLTGLKKSMDDEIRSGPLQAAPVMS